MVTSKLVFRDIKMLGFIAICWQLRLVGWKGNNLVMDRDIQARDVLDINERAIELSHCQYRQLSRGSRNHLPE